MGIGVRKRLIVHSRPKLSLFSPRVSACFPVDEVASCKRHVKKRQMSNETRPLDSHRHRLKVDGAAGGEGERRACGDEGWLSVLSGIKSPVG